MNVSDLNEENDNKIHPLRRSDATQWVRLYEKRCVFAKSFNTMAPAKGLA